jgi:hypothetical protein
MRKSLTFIVVGVLIVLSVTFASYIVLTKFNPDLEIRRMLIAMSDLETFRYSAGYSWTNEDESGRVNTTLYISGQAFIADLSKIEHTTNFRLVHFGSSDSYNDLSGELRVFDETTYLSYNPPGPDIENITFDEDQKWISFNRDELPVWGAIIPTLNPPIEFTKSERSWTEESMKKLRYLIAFADVLTAEYNGLTEIIHGENTAIIDARINPLALESFLLDVIRVKEDREPSDDDRVLASTQAAQLSNLSVRLWIGTNTHYLHRVQVGGFFAQEDSVNPIPVDVRIDFSDFNKPFEGQTPDNVRAFKTVLTSVLSNLPDADRLGASKSFITIVDEDVRLPVEKIETSSDVDGDGLDAVLEAFYGTDPLNPDTDGDGMSDGDEVRAGRNPRGPGSLFGFGL